MLNILSRLISAGELAQESKEAIDYWREYKGQRIRIERVNMYEDEYTGDYVKRRHGIEGRVEKIMNLPPGFVLENAFDFQDAEHIEVVEEEERLPHKKQDRVFVAFQSVERITFPEDADDDS